MDRLRVFCGGFKSPVTRATTVLAFICLIDTAYTLAVVHLGIARETNPLLSHMLERSDALFVVVKGMLSIVPLVLIELLRPFSPNFIRSSLRFGAIAYLAIYALGTVAFCCRMG